MPAESMQNADQHSAGTADSPPDLTPFRLSIAMPLQEPEELCWLETFATSIRGDLSLGMHKLKQDDQQQACLQDRRRSQSKPVSTQQVQHQIQRLFG